MNGCPRPAAVVRLMSPRVDAAMSAIPDDSPSSPSMKLMLLIIPTIQTMVNATANASRGDQAGPERVGDEVDRDPEGDRHERDSELADELPAGPDLEDVVEEADRRGDERRR